MANKIPLNIQLFTDSYKTTTFSEGNISVANNTSSLTINISFSSASAGTYFSAATLYCSCNGSTQSTTVSMVRGGSASASFTFYNIAHNSDGSKTVSWSWSCSTGTSIGTVSDSGTKTLTKIARAPSYTSKNATNITEHSVRLTGTVDTKSLSITGGGWDLSTNGGSSWTYYSGGPTDKTITGLNPGTQYWYRGYVTTAGGGANSGWGTFTTQDCVMRTNVNGTWKTGVPYINVNGTWKKGIPYINVNGTWKEGIH